MNDRPADLTLTNWDMGGESSAWAYLHAGTLLGSVEISAGGPVVPLGVDELAGVASFDTGGGMSLDAYVAAAPVSGIVVLRGGTIVFERYPRMRPDDRHLLMSVPKVFASVLVGLLEERGQVDLSRPVDAYVEELAGSGWAGVPVRDVLGMASGIDCREVGNPGAYTDPARDPRRAVDAAARPGPVRDAVHFRVGDQRVARAADLFARRADAGLSGR